MSQLDPARGQRVRNMKKSSEWVRQSVLDKKLDELVEDRGCTAADLNIYDAAKVLEIAPGGEFYKKVHDWKQRRTAESISKNHGN